MIPLFLRLKHWNPNILHLKQLDNLVFGVGFIAEEVYEAGLHEFVTKDPISGEITGLVYEHMVAPLLKLIQKYKDTIEQHEFRIAILESRVQTLENQ